MFSQKRRNYRNWVWVAIACTAVAFVVFLLLGYLSRNNDEPYARTNGSDQMYEQPMDKPNDETTVEKDPLTEIEGAFQSYYLVKYDKDVIRVFFSDSSGKVTELEETSIIYETLSEEDQRRFDDGVKLESRNELNQLLMNYES